MGAVRAHQGAEENTVPIRKQLFETDLGIELIGEDAGWELRVTQNGPKPEFAHRTQDEGTPYSLP